MAKKNDERRDDAPRRKRLEALRDDCRRHKRGAVALSQRRREGRASETDKPILAARTDEDEHDAKGFLDRLGELIADAPDLLERLGLESVEGGWRRSRALAMDALLRKRSWRKVIETSATFLDSEDRPTVAPETVCVTFERRSPDLVASIAELCDELLEVKPSAERRRRAEKVGYLAWLGIATDFEKRNGRKPQGKEMASMLGMHPSTFSRGIGRTEKWKNYAAPAVRDPKREPKK